MIERDYKTLSISNQCDLLSVPRSTYYYTPIPATEYNLLIMREIDKMYLDYPSFGSRRICACLIAKNFDVNRKRVSRLMKNMGIEAIYPKPKIRVTDPGSRKFPYLLTDLDINTKNLVWGTDITYIPVAGGYIYLVAFLDLYSRFVLSWCLSNTLESGFCIEALRAAFEFGFPKIINSDQGIQFTSHAYVELVESRGVSISMSGKGKCWDNIFVERFWRTLKYEEVFLKQYSDVKDAHENIAHYIESYNQQRPHSALNYRTPYEIYLIMNTEKKALM